MDRIWKTIENACILKIQPQEKGSRDRRVQIKEITNIKEKQIRRDDIFKTQKGINCMWNMFRCYEIDRYCQFIKMPACFLQKLHSWLRNIQNKNVLINSLSRINLQHSHKSINIILRKLSPITKKTIPQNPPILHNSKRPIPKTLP